MGKTQDFVTRSQENIKALRKQAKEEDAKLKELRKILSNRALQTLLDTMESALPGRKVEIRLNAMVIVVKLLSDEGVDDLKARLCGKEYGSFTPQEMTLAKDKSPHITHYNCYWVDLGHGWHMEFGHVKQESLDDHK